MIKLFLFVMLTLLLGYPRCEGENVMVNDDPALLIWDKDPFEWPEYHHENPVISWQINEEDQEWQDIRIEGKYKVYLYETDKDVVYIYKDREFKTLYSLARYILRGKK